MKYLEVMWAEQAPDVYDGPECDQHKPDWRTNELGSKEPDSSGMDLIELKADNWPAGTKIVISVPLCPDCGESAELGGLASDKKCDCGFDWKGWANNEYS